MFHCFHIDMEVLVITGAMNYMPFSLAVFPSRLTCTKQRNDLFDLDGTRPKLPSLATPVVTCLVNSHVAAVGKTFVVQQDELRVPHGQLLSGVIRGLHHRWNEM